MLQRRDAADQRREKEFYFFQRPMRVPCKCILILFFFFSTTFSYCIHTLAMFDFTHLQLRVFSQIQRNCGVFILTLTSWSKYNHLRYTVAYAIFYKLLLQLNSNCLETACLQFSLSLIVTKIVQLMRVGARQDAICHGLS